MKPISLSFILLATLLFSVISQAGTVAWFYALDADKAAFEAIAGTPLRSTRTGSRVVHEYRVGPHRVVAARMGSGCVNTAVTVASVLALHPADRVISTGPAGAIGGGVETGQWVRVENVVAWQKGRMEGDRVLTGDPMEAPLQAESWPAGPWQQMKTVRLASGEAFIASADARERVQSATGAPLVEMNAFGLLAALDGRNIECLILRVVSDRADEQAAEDFSAFVKRYDGAGGKMVAELVKALPVGKDEPSAHEALRELLEETEEPAKQ